MTDTEMVELLGRLDERTERMSDALDKITHVLFEGNGTPAITTQVADINARVRTLETATVPRPVLYGLVVTIVLGVLGIVLHVV